MYNLIDIHSNLQLSEFNYSQVKLQTDLQLYALVFELHGWTYVANMSMKIVDDLICLPLNSTYGIRLSLHQPWGKHTYIY